MLPLTLSQVTRVSTLGGLLNGLCILPSDSACANIFFVRVNQDFVTPTGGMKNVAVENGRWKNSFFHPLDCALVDGVTVCHFVSLIHIAHVMVIIHHNLQLYGFSSFTAGITFHRSIMNVHQHTDVSLVPPQYHHISRGPYAHVSLLSHHSSTITSALVLMHMSLSCPTTVVPSHQPWSLCTCLSLVPPQYHHISPGPYAHVSPFQ